MKTDALHALFRAAPKSRNRALPFSGRLVHQHLEKMREGKLILVDKDVSTTFGDPTSDDLAHIFINHPDAYRKIAAGGAIGGAEAFMDGDWTTDNLTHLIRLLLRNRDVLDSIQSDFSFLRNLSYRLYHWMRRDSIRGSRRNIHAHYDLGNDFFRLFLDPTLSYSAGIFQSARDTMEEASVRKIDRLCRKLDLGPDDHLLEIGTGWGALAIHAATRYGCKVTTTTISEEQFDWTAKRIGRLGLEDRITLLNKDYRELEGTFDKLVSVEMIEAVGLDNMPAFFRKCESLLKPEGEMILQSITIADQRYEQARRSVDFIQRYIFPGGALPSVTALNEAATRHTDLRAFDLQDITAHYALTLRRWRDAFRKNLHLVGSLGFDKRFVRMWEYYLCYCEAGFRERAIGCVQIRFHRPNYRTSELS